MKGRVFVTHNNSWLYFLKALDGAVSNAENGAVKAPVLHQERGKSTVARMLIRRS